MSRLGALCCWALCPWEWWWGPGWASRLGPVPVLTALSYLCMPSPTPKTHPGPSAQEPGRWGQSGNVLKQKLTLRPRAFCQVPVAFLTEAVGLRVFKKRKGVKGKQPKIKMKLTNTYMFAADT